MKQFGNPPLSMNLLISEQFFHDPPSLSKFQKQEPPPNSFFFVEGGLCIMKPVFFKAGLSLVFLKQAPMESFLYKRELFLIC